MVIASPFEDDAIPVDESIATSTEPHAARVDAA
jgi:hypothetical protein